MLFYTIIIIPAVCLYPDTDNALDPDPEKDTPVKPGVHSECADNMTFNSPTDGNTIQCRNVPPALNKKDIIEKHFGQFGKVRKIFCRPAKNMAIVQFDDHVSNFNTLNFTLYECKVG